MPCQMTLHNNLKETKLTKKNGKTIAATIELWDVSDLQEISSLR
jgi:hypothetical protein